MVSGSSREAIAIEVGRSAHGMRLGFALAAAGAVAGVYALWLLAASPSGEFPLNDDWAYAWSVRHLLRTGELRISEWSSASAIFPVYWGALFSQLAGGFSFTALRISTLIFSLVSPVALLWLLRCVGIPRSAALLGVLTLIVNPLFVHLSYTFMTDIFYLGLMLVGLALYVDGIERDSARSLWAASLAATLAFLCRQLGLALPLAAACVLLVRRRRQALRPMLRAVLLPALAFAAYTWWLNEVNGVPWAFRLYTVQNGLATLLRTSAPAELAVRLLQVMLYLGIFTLPALVAVAATRPLWFWRKARPLWPLFGGWLLALAGFALYARLAHGEGMPYLLGVINRDGIGAQTLTLGQKPRIPPEWIFDLVTLVAPVAGAASGALWTNVFRDVRREINGPGAVVLLAALIMAPPTASMAHLWDHYLLVFIPASLYLTLRGAPVSARGGIAGALVCGSMLAYTLPEQAEYLAWNDARWRVGRQLVRQHVPPVQIDGGFEWVGWFDFERALPIALAAGYSDNPGAWMTIFPDRYLLTFEPVEGTRIVASARWRTRFGSEGTVLAVERETSRGATVPPRP